MTNIIPFIFIVLTLALLSACASSPVPPQKPQQSVNNYDFVRQKLNWIIAQEMKKNRLSGLSIALVEGDNIVWQQGFGFADKDHNMMVTPQTRFRAGSLIKPLNAIALLTLEENNSIDLTSPVQRYLSDFSPPSRYQNRTPITIVDCLTHLSGLPSNLIKGMWASEPEDFKTSLRYLHSAYVAQPPNTVFRYSNLAHNVLGAVIETQSDEPYAQHMKRLFTQLGMQQSEVLAKPSGLAKAYAKGKQVTVFGLRDVPAAGLVSNAEDLAQLLVFFNRHSQVSNTSENISAHTPPPLLSAKSWHKMMQDYTGHLALNLGKRHGLGLIFYDGIFHNSLKVYGHGGASVNHRALIKFIPRETLGVALLSNDKNSSNSLHSIANQALSLLLEAKRGKRAPYNSARWPSLRQGDIVDPEKMLGHYATAGGMAKVYRKRGRYYVNIAGRKLTLYQREQGGLFYLHYKLFGVIPIDLGYFSRLAFAVRNISGHDYLISTNTRGVQNLVGPKVSPRKIPQAWRQRVGAYRVINPLEVVDISSGGLKIEDGFLIAYATIKHGDTLSVMLLPTNDNEAIVAGLESGFGETVSALTHNDKEALRFSNILFGKR